MLRSLLVSTAVAVALTGAMTAQTVPTGFVLETLVSTVLSAPNDVCFLPDGRALIANRAGAIVVYAGGSPVTIGTVPNVQVSNEQALLSIAADPNFATNGYIYVWYASSLDAFMHLDRFTCTGTLSNPTSTALTLDTASRRVVLQSTPDNAYNHNGGAARFGPDGMLYVTMGDDATGGCPAQTTTSSLGCLMRLDVSTLPAGGSATAPSFSTLDPGNNPLSANADISQLVIAHGFRNPFRIDIDPLTGNVYIGDVGQVTLEEYSEYIYPSVGALPLRNYGWPWIEGTATYNGCGGSAPSGLIVPLAVEGGNWASIMGGPRYRNLGGPYAFGASYEGDAFYLDYFDGTLRRLDHNGTSWPASPTTWGTGYVGVTSLRQGPDGALWFTQHPNIYATSGGTLKRIRPLGPTNSVTAISGGGQVGTSGEAFAQPIVARVFDTQNNPLPGGTVNFAVTGPGILSTTNPVLADANGYAQTTVTASSTIGGAITVTASTPGSQTNGTFSLFSRRMTVTPASNLIVVQVTNTTTAVPANVPYIIMASFPRTPVLPTFFGTVFTNPYSPTTLVLEDAFGHFTLAGWTGAGNGIGTPGFSRVFTPPVGLLTGYRITFQAVGLDPITGWFRTNTEVKQF